MTTLVIATVGCVTGTLALLLQYLSYRRDRHKIDFDFSVSMTRCSAQEALRPVLQIWVINLGRVPIGLAEINWLVRHCDIKELGTGFEQKDTDIRLKLFDAQKEGYVKLEHNDRHDFRFPFSSPPLFCSEHSSIEVVDALGKRYEKPTGTWPSDFLQTTLRTARGNAC